MSKASEVMESDVAESLAVGQTDQSLFTFLPEEIIQDEAVNLRPFGDDLGGDIEELAESIRTRGQIEPVVVRIDSEGRPHLIAGKRRLTAVSLINAGLNEGDEPFRVKALISLGADTDEQAWGMAWAENKDRENMSPMDEAMNIKRVREMMDWPGKSSTKKVQEYLGFKSSADVTTREKLLSLPRGIQAKVHEGKLSMDAALKAASAPEEVREEVIKTATALATAEQVKEEEKARKSGKKAKARTAKKGKGGSIVKGRHVVAAKRKIKGAEKRPTPRSKGELVAFVESEILSPLYGYANGDVHQFGNCLLGWLKGGESDKALLGRFRTMVNGAEKGSPSPALEPVKKAVKKSATAVKKAAPKAKARARARAKAKAEPKK